MKLSGVMKAGTTVVVGLNGALQKRFILAPETQLVPGDVHRAQSIQVGMGGKGQDVLVTLSCLQYNNVQISQYIGSGAEGEALFEMLQESYKDSLDLTVRTESGMRTCTSIVSDSSTTELVEPSGEITKPEMKELLEKVSSIKADAVCIMGSMPPGCAEETYAKIYEGVADGKNTLCLIDSVAGLGPLLKQIASSGGPAILKCNASELCRLAGIKKSRSEAYGVQQEELIQAIKSFLGKSEFESAREALTAIAITDGLHPAYLAVLPVLQETEFRLFQLPITELFKEENDNGGGGGGGDDEKALGRTGSNSSWGQWTEKQAAEPSKPSQPIYPIGAGDAVAAGTIAAWKALTEKPSGSSSTRMNADILASLAGNESPMSRAILTAFSFGLACGTASCLNEENSVVKVDEVLDFFKKQERPLFLSCQSVL